MLLMEVRAAPFSLSFFSIPRQNKQNVCQDRLRTKQNGRKAHTSKNAFSLRFETHTARAEGLRPAAVALQRAVILRAEPPHPLEIRGQGRLLTPVNISTTACQIQTGWSPRSERSFER
jgi:hypothetical protein